MHFSTLFQLSNRSAQEGIYYNIIDCIAKQLMTRGDSVLVVIVPYNVNSKN